MTWYGIQCFIRDTAISQIYPVSAVHFQAYARPDCAVCGVVDFMTDEPEHQRLLHSNRIREDYEHAVLRRLAYFVDSRADEGRGGFVPRHQPNRTSS